MVTAEEANRSYTSQRQSQRNKFLIASPLLGAAAGYWQLTQAQKRIDTIEIQITKEKAAFKASYSQASIQVAQKMLSDPQIQQEIAALKANGKAKPEEMQAFIRSIMAKGTQIVAKDPSVGQGIASNIMLYTANVNALKAEEQQIQSTMSGSVANAFFLAASLPLVALILVSSYRYLFSFKAPPMQKHAEPKKETAVLPISNVPAANDTTPQPPKSAKRLIRPQEYAKPHDQPREFDFEGLVKSKERKATKSDPPKRKGLFSEDTSSLLRERGFQAPEVEKALIRSFKILSSNGIYIAMRYAQTPDIKRDIRRALGNEQKADALYNLLNSEELLQFHKGGDCVSLNPKPGKELGQMIIRDIGAKLVDMGKSSKKGTGTES